MLKFENRANIPLNALMAFEASARHLSFTRAARELNVTQGAVSRQVKLLEHHPPLEKPSDLKHFPLLHNSPGKRIEFRRMIKKCSMAQQILSDNQIDKIQPITL